MKKSIRILALVLSVAVICGALIIAAFAYPQATITGVEDRVFLGFENQTVGHFADFTTTQYHSFTAEYKAIANQPMYDTINRTGVATINQDVKGNKYFSVDGAGSGTSYNPYINLYVAANPAAADFVLENSEYTGENNVQYKLRDYYAVLDLDLWSPTGVLNKGGAIKLHCNGWMDKADGSGGAKASYVNPAIAAVNLGNDATGSYIQASGTNYYIDMTKWNHVTIVEDAKVMTDDDGEYLDIYATLWVNGVFKATWKVGSTQDNTPQPNYKFVYDRTAVNYREVRLGTLSTADGDGSSTAFDNIHIRAIDKDAYTGNLASVIAGQKDMTEWDASLYNRANMPYTTTVAVNTETGEEYDDLAYAIEMAENNDTIVLKGNCTDDVENIAKNITIITAKNGVDAADGVYTVGQLKNAQGYSVVASGEEGAIYKYVIAEAQESLLIDWNACTCPLCTAGEADEAHPGGVSTEINLGANIYDSYVDQGGKSHDFVVVVGTQQYVLVGWKNADTGDVIAKDATVDEDLLAEGYIALEPVWLIRVPTYSYTSNAGKEIIAFDDTTFADVITGAKRNSTITLLNDVKVATGAAIRPTRGFTLDLDGYTIDAVTTGAKHDLIWPNTTSEKFTFKSTTPGGKIFHAKANGAGALFNSGFMIQTSKNEIVFEGDGLAVYCAVVIGGTNVKATIDGGEYYQTAADQFGLFQFNSLDDVTIKNATLYANEKTVIAARDRYEPAAGAKEQITIDNCEIYARVISNLSHDGLKVTITNSYLVGNIDPLTTGALDDVSADGGEWIIGEGCYVAEGSVLNEQFVKLADGVKKVEAPTKKTITLNLNTFTVVEAGKVDPSTYVITKTDKECTFATYYTANDPTVITWYDVDGTTVLGTTESYPGFVAIPPASVSAADGWVKATYNEWLNANGGEDLTVPEAETASFTLKEGSTYTYVAGDVLAYINYALYNHFELAIYLPKAAELPEGIEITSVYCTTGTKAIANSGGNYLIDGVTMDRYAAYPTARGMATNQTITVNYTYNGTDITYISPEFCAGSYADAVFTDATVSADEKALVADMLAYIVEAQNIANSAINDATMTAYNNYKSYCTPVPAYEEVTGDISALAPYISDIKVAYSIGHGGLQFRFKMTSDAIANGVAVNCTGFSFSPSRDFTNADLYTSGSAKYTITHNTKIYDFALDTFTIQVVDKDGVELASVQYSFRQYMTSVKDTATAEEWSLLETTLAYATTAKKVASK